jgi:hypothetical protein
MNRDIACFEILKQKYDESKWQNTFTGILSLTTTFFPLEKIRSKLINFQLTSIQQDIVVQNLIFNEGLSINDLFWEPQDQFVGQVSTLKSFLIDLFKNQSAKSHYLLRLLSRCDSVLEIYFTTLKDYSSFDLELMINFRIAGNNTNTNIFMPEYDPDIFDFSYILRIILQIIEDNNTDELIEIFADRLNTIENIQSFIIHPYQLSAIRFLMKYTNSPLYEEVSRLDESLNPNGSKPFHFFTDHIPL